MDRLAIPQKAKELFHKYKYVLLVLAIGLLLMALPEQPQEPKAESEPEPSAAEEGMESRLVKILGQIDGVGKVQVLLSESSGEEVFYQTDQDSTATDTTNTVRMETVILSGGNREEAGLIRKVNPPSYLGAVVVCQGGNLPSVQLAVVEAVSNATGISADRITVLKMK